MIFRGPPPNVAFCGGIDLAFTRCDAPPQPNPDINLTRFQGGDCQAGNGMPRDADHTDYATFGSAAPPRFPIHKQDSDLSQRDHAPEKI